MLVLWLYVMKCLCCLLCCRFKLMVCGMVQSLVLNCFVLSSLCVMSLLCRYVVGVLCADKPPKSHNLTLPTLSQFSQMALVVPELKCCFIVCECLVLASPLVVLCVKPLFAWTFNVPLCLCGLCYSALPEGELKCLPIVPK